MTCMTGRAREASPPGPFFRMDEGAPRYLTMKDDGDAPGIVLRTEPLIAVA
jgi:hypothetical protein